MKVLIYTIEYRVSEIGWGRDPIPREFSSELRIPLFHELIEYANVQKVSLVVLPGGFFRTDHPAGIANALKHNPPQLNVVVGRDDKANKFSEVWVMAQNGTIRRKIPEAWIQQKNESKRQSILEDVSDRRFQIRNKFFAAFCCGDVIIDKRKAPITNSEATFVLSHYSAKGRNFTPSMRKLNIPVFLSHHVRDPYSTTNFAYHGNRDLKADTELKGKSQGLKWISRIYTI